MAEEAAKTTAQASGENQQPAQQNKQEESKTFTQDQVNEIVSQRLAKFKLEAIDKAAEVKAAEALDQVSKLQARLEASDLEAQILKLSQAGANENLLRKTGLKGEALDSFAADLIAALPAKAPGGASQKATVVDFINRTVANEGKATDWKDAALADINSQLGR